MKNETAPNLLNRSKELRDIGMRDEQRMVQRNVGEGMRHGKNV